MNRLGSALRLLRPDASALRLLLLAALRHWGGAALACAALALAALSYALARLPRPLARRLYGGGGGGSGGGGALSPALRRVRCIAHRGARLEGVAENSLAAFAHALAHGADMVELDVRRTADGAVVVFHDATLGRMCGAAHEGRLLSEVPYADLPPLAPADPGQQPPPDDRQGGAGGGGGGGGGGGKLQQSIPLLSEVLSLVGARTALIVEFKELDAALVAATHALLHQHRAARTVLWFGLQVSVLYLRIAISPSSTDESRRLTPLLVSHSLLSLVTAGCWAAGLHQPAAAPRRSHPPHHQLRPRDAALLRGVAPGGGPLPAAGVAQR